MSYWPTRQNRFGATVGSIYHWKYCSITEHPPILDFESDLVSFVTKGQYFAARSPIQGGTRRNFVLECLHSIISHDKCKIWLSIYSMKKILPTLGWIEIKSAKIIHSIFLQSTLQSMFFNDVMGLIFRKCNSVNKINIKISSKLCNILSIQNKRRKISFLRNFIRVRDRLFVSYDYWTS